MTYQMESPKSTSLSFSFYLDSNYTNDIKYIEQLSFFIKYPWVTVGSFNFYLLYEENSNNLVNDCYKSKLNKLYCLPSNEYALGRDRILNSILILNYFYKIQSYTIFHTYYQALSSNCRNNYSTNCNENVLITQKAKPDYDDSILRFSFLLYKEAIPSVSFFNFFCYNENYFIHVYYFATKGSYYYTDVDCNSELLYNDICDNPCNISRLGYDNLKCLEKNGCYSFMIGDNNCNKNCEGDPDCNDDSLDYTLIIILVPILGFLFICMSVIITIICIFTIKRRKMLSKNETKIILYTSHMNHQGDPICILDLNQIVNGENVFFLSDTCKHIFHEKCYFEWKSQNMDKTCPACLTEKKMD